MSSGVNVSSGTNAAAKVCVMTEVVVVVLVLVLAARCSGVLWLVGNENLTPFRSLLLGAGEFGVDSGPSLA